MKTSQSTRNIRKYLLSQNGRSKRVKSLVDDYGNRVHVAKKKNGSNVIRNASGVHGAKKRVAKMDGTKRGKYRIVDNEIFPHNYRAKKTKRHADSLSRREAKNTINSPVLSQKKQKFNDLKIAYHTARINDPKDYSKHATKSAKAIHGNRRKSKDFTK